MARYTGPKTRIARRFGEAIFGSDKVFEKRNYPPGQHGQNRRKKTSEYGSQLNEKQKVKYTYGVLERQFRRVYADAKRMKGVTGEVLLSLLESRLDNVVYRMGIAPTRAAARQLVLHGHFTVNGKKVNIPSFLVKKGDVVAVAAKSKKSPKFQAIAELAAVKSIPQWLALDKDNLVATVADMPARDAIDIPIEEHLIVELYSR